LNQAHPISHNTFIWRILVAIARTIRLGGPLNAQTIVANKHSNALPTVEIVPLLTDFVRREILREKGRSYEFVVPLFQEWLVQKGVAKLISDTLGDEIADAIQQAEDTAYVTAAEVTELVEVYRNGSAKSCTAPTGTSRSWRAP
jgi:hypothetical protein